MKGSKNYHADYDVSGSSDMEDKAKVFGDFTEPVAYGNVFCSVLQFSIRYKDLTSEKKEEQDINREHSGRVCMRERSGRE